MVDQDALSKTLQGYSYPLSPSGEESFLSPPPWHFSGLVILVEYTIAPQQAQAFLPSAAVAAGGPMNAAAVFSRWQCTAADGADLASPACSSFNEFQILFGCTYRGKDYARCPFAWVDSAASIARGWIQGMPKQIGDVALSHELGIGRASPRREAGGQYYGTAAAAHRRIATMDVTLTQPAQRLPRLFELPLLHSRINIPWLSGEVRTVELVASNVEDVEFGDVWSGDGRCDITAVTNDLASLRPDDVGSGFVFSYAETLTGGLRIS
jgi:enduracididine biosynthesis enzyme MppR